MCILAHLEHSGPGPRTRAAIGPQRARVRLVGDKPAQPTNGGGREMITATCISILGRVHTSSNHLHNKKKHAIPPKLATHTTKGKKKRSPTQTAKRFTKSNKNTQRGRTYNNTQGDTQSENTQTTQNTRKTKTHIQKHAAQENSFFLHRPKNKQSAPPPATPTSPPPPLAPLFRTAHPPLTKHKTALVDRAIAVCLSRSSRTHEQTNEQPQQQQRTMYTHNLTQKALQKKKTKSSTIRNTRTALT